jgi:hypothetical protein
MIECDNPCSEVGLVEYTIASIQASASQRSMPRRVLRKVFKRSGTVVSAAFNICPETGQNVVPYEFLRVKLFS